LADFAATLKKGAHVQVEGELRGREYEKDGVKQLDKTLDQLDALASASA